MVVVNEVPAAILVRSLLHCRVIRSWRIGYFFLSKSSVGNKVLAFKTLIMIVSLALVSVLMVLNESYHI